MPDEQKKEEPKIPGWTGKVEDAPVFSWAQRILKRGLETYDDTQPKGQRSGNLGGAQLYQVNRWKGEQAEIYFNDERFGKVLKSLAASFFSVNRVELDVETGEPIMVRNPNPTKGTQRRRVDSGIILFTQFGERGQEARDMAKRIVEACPELEGFICAAADIIDKVPELQNLSKRMILVQGAGSEERVSQPVNPLKCVLIAIPSGSQTSSQRWGFKQGSRPVTRANLDASTQGGATQANDQGSGEDEILDS